MVFYHAKVNKKLNMYRDVLFDVSRLEQRLRLAVSDYITEIIINRP